MKKVEPIKMQHRMCGLAIVCMAILLISQVAQGDNRPLSKKTPTAAPPAGQFQWCHQVRRAVKYSRLLEPAERLAPASENEPNDSLENAQVLLLGGAEGEDVDLDVSGSISSGGDVDYYRFSAKKGDMIGVACNAVSVLMDSKVFVLDGNGVVIFMNDDGDTVQSAYPGNAPWPKIGVNTDSALTFVVPSDGLYHLRIEPYGPSTIGSYILKIRERMPYLHEFEAPARQTVFIDFDGATIDISAIFLPGFPSLVRTLSPLSSFLAGWGLASADQNAVIDAVLATIEENFDSLRVPALNNNLRLGGPAGSFDVVILNSRDHPDPFGENNVSRIIVGGSTNEFIIQTIGLAESIDPGNFNTKETGVVLLDFLSGPATGDTTCCSLNDIPRAPGANMIELIGVAVGNIVTHEIGHYLGNFHTTSGDNTLNIMDEGGQLNSFLGAGPNGTFGDGDDVDVDFVSDSFSGFEEMAFGSNDTAVNTAFGLSTGKLAGLPPTLIETVPPRDTDLGKLQQLTVTFSEPVVGIHAGVLKVNGSSAQSISGTGAGPYLFSGFNIPLNGPVNCELAGGQIKDAVGNTFAGEVLAFTIKDCNGNGVVDESDISGGYSLDCNGNQLADECDPSILRSRDVDVITMNAGETVALGEYAPFAGGDPPLSIKWTLRGNPGGEESTELNAVYGPLPADIYVPRLEVTDGNGCTVVSFLTIKVLGEDSTDSTGGTSGTGGNTNTPGGQVQGQNCGQGSACGVSGGGLMAMVCAYLGLFGYRQQRR